MHRLSPLRWFTPLVLLTACAPSPRPAEPPALRVRLAGVEAGLGDAELALVADLGALGGEALPEGRLRWRAWHGEHSLGEGESALVPPTPRGSTRSITFGVPVEVGALPDGALPFGDDGLDVRVEVSGWESVSELQTGVRLVRPASFTLIGVEIESATPPLRSRLHLDLLQPNSEPIEIGDFVGRFESGASGTAPWTGRALVPPGGTPTRLSLLLDDVPAPDPSEPEGLRLSGTYSLSATTGRFEVVPFTVRAEYHSICTSGMFNWHIDEDGDGWGTGEAVSRCGPVAPGWSLRAGDCDDADPRAWPGAIERCNGKDDDCSGLVDNGDFVWAAVWPDGDGDGWGDDQTDAVEVCAPKAGFVARAGDCDDTDAAIRPGQPDLDCDDVDDDCDGTPDQAAFHTTVYADEDGDGEGDPTTGRAACNPAWNQILNAGDCDDTDPTVNTRGIEVCDTVDNDCNGRIDERIVDASPQRVCVSGHWWTFDTEGAPHGAGAAVLGPGGNPMGQGALSFVLPTASQAPGGAKAKWRNPEWAGLRLDQIEAFRFAAFRTAPNTGSTLPYVQFQVDVSGAREDIGFDGFLTWEAYVTEGAVPAEMWFEMDLMGKGWTWVGGSKPAGPPACTPAAPCRLADVLDVYPNARVHPRFDGLYLKAGSGWNAGHTGYVDSLRLDVGGRSWVYDFEAFTDD